MTKLTLSMDAQVVALAKQLAARRHTTVSALFAELVTTLAGAEQVPPTRLPPLTRAASGLIGPLAGDHDEALADALAAKHRR